MTPPSSDSDGSAPARRPFLERPSAIVTLVGGILGILVTTLTLTGALGGGDGGGDGDGRQQRIATCITDHGLSKAVEREQVSDDRVVFRGCAWPAPPGAAADGFGEITVASRQGPGQSEAEGMTVADVLTTTCRDVEVRYLFDNMGTFVPEQPVLLTKGEVRRAEGGSLWSPGSPEEELEYRPGRDQSIVMSAARYRLDSARCVA